MAKVVMLSALELIVCLLSVGFASAQQNFQVATIKPSLPGTEKHTQIRGNQFATTGTTLEDLIKFAYNLHFSQIVGGPDWLRRDPYDILADPEVNRRPTQDEVKLMLAQLMAERFQLKLLHDHQELPVFALVQLAHPPNLVKRDEAPGNLLSGGLDPSGILYVHYATLTDFGHYLQRLAPEELNRPVVDATNIAGRYDFTLHFARENKAGGIAPAEGSDGQYPDVFGAVEQQLGLKVKPTRAIIDVLKISSVARPTSN